jgi:hypothetical protein
MDAKLAKDRRERQPRVACLSAPAARPFFSVLSTKSSLRVFVAFVIFVMLRDTASRRNAKILRPRASVDCPIQAIV